MGKPLLSPDGTVQQAHVSHRAPAQHSLCTSQPSSAFGQKSAIAPAGGSNTAEGPFPDLDTKLGEGGVLCGFHADWEMSCSLTLGPDRAGPLPGVYSGTYSEIGLLFFLLVANS